MELSTNQKLIKLAFDKGYRIIDGECITPKNKKLSGTIKQHPIPYRQLSIKTEKGARSIFYHALLAYQLYGDAYFQTKMVARHKNGNSLDNSVDNIILGTQKQNRNDITPIMRSDSIKLGHKTKRKLTIETLTDIETDYKNGMGAKKLYIKYSVALGTMYKIIQKFNK